MEKVKNASDYERGMKQTAIKLSKLLKVNKEKLSFGKDCIKIKVKSDSPFCDLYFNENGNLDITLSSGKINFNDNESLLDFMEITETIKALKKDKELTKEIAKVLSQL